MSGAQHYTEAERLVDAASLVKEHEVATEYLAAAQVHATLALAAATIDAARSVTTTSPAGDFEERTVADSAIANEADWAEVVA